MIVTDSYAQSHDVEADISVTETEYVYHMERPCGFTFSKENIPYHTMALIISGSADYRCGSEHFAVQPGDLLFFHKNTTYSAQVISSEPWEHIVISFRTGEGEDLRGFPLETVNKVTHSKQLEELFRQAFQVWSQCAFAYKIQVKAIVTQILFEVISENFNHFFDSDTAQISLKAVTDHIEQYYMTKITVEDMAKISGYSASHFARIFTKVYGVSPIRYLNLIRIMHAKNLLRTNQYTTSEIAQKCGFSNVYYFSRCFKQLTGTTPKRW